MAVEKIDQDLCIRACGRCVDTCEADVLRLGEDGQARIVYPEDCHTCLWCALECPAGAITVRAATPMAWASSFYP